MKLHRFNLDSHHAQKQRTFLVKQKSHQPFDALALLAWVLRFETVGHAVFSPAAMYDTTHDKWVRVNSISRFSMTPCPK